MSTDRWNWAVAPVHPAPWRQTRRLRAQGRGLEAAERCSDRDLRAGFGRAGPGQTDAHERRPRESPRAAAPEPPDRTLRQVRNPLTCGPPRFALRRRCGHRSAPFWPAPRSATAQGSSATVRACSPARPPVEVRHSARPPRASPCGPTKPTRPMSPTSSIRSRFRRRTRRIC